MYVLGISAYYHDSAAVLVKDGAVLCAIEEERFSRIKHDNSFPYRAIEFCLRSAELGINDIDVVSYYEKPLLKFERIIDMFAETWPYALRPFLRSIPEWLGDKIKIEHTIRTKLGFKGSIAFVPHHLSHAASSFYPSPYKKAAILTIDGVGEYQTTGLWLGSGESITLLKHLNFPHSVGLLYSTFTSFLGFKVNEDEYKLMGLAAYGKPLYEKHIKKIVDIKDDGSFRLNMEFFSFREGYQMWSRDFEKLLGKPRNNNTPLDNRHRNLASSIQAVTEELYFKMLNHLYTLTGQDTVCISGGVGLNALANGKIYAHTPFKKVFIFGAAGDNGGALGSALYASKIKRKAINTLSLGTSYTNRYIEQALKTRRLSFEKLPEDRLVEKTARLLADGRIVGWFQGKAEFGPRALGNHSILCKPNPRNMKTRMNLIKLREQFRPFAGSILQEKVHEYFEVPEKNHWSPFMVVCFPVKQSKRKDLAAIVHSDGTCRIQTVNAKNGRYYKLIKSFYKKTGVACVLNTSFNLKGEPIVETPEQAIGDFLKTKMDFLVMENYLVKK